MSDNTAIEWTKRPGTTGATMNALVGCQKVSQGCAHCYAIETAHLRAGNPLPVLQEKFGGTTRVEGGKRVWTGKVTLTESALLAPLRKKKPRTYFVNALSDLFYDEVPDEWIDRHFAVFALCPQHTFIVLTKRPERMLAYMRELDVDGHDMAGSDGAMRWATEAGGFFPRGKALDRLIGEFIADAHEDVSAINDDDDDEDPEDFYKFKPIQWPLPNVWFGVSVEDQATADARIPLLLQTPAAVRIVSYEPALGPVDFRDLNRTPSDFDKSMPGFALCKRFSVDSLRGSNTVSMTDTAYQEERGTRPALDWVICGGESGPGARPMHPDWVRSVRDKCVDAGVPFFFKQWGEWAPGAQGADYRRADRAAFDRINLAGKSVRNLPAEHAAFDGMMYRVGKKAAGNLLDGKVWQQFPEVHLG